MKTKPYSPSAFYLMFLIITFNYNPINAAGFQWVKAEELNYRSVSIDDVCKTGNGGFLIAGTKYFSSWHSAFLEGYDSLGTKIYTAGLSPSYSEVLSVGSDSIGNFYFIMYVYNYYSSASFGGVTFNNPTGNTSWQFLVKSDKNGNYQWHKILNSTGIDYSQKLCVEQDGKFSIASSSSCASFDSSGTQIWSNTQIVGSMIKSDGQYIYVGDASTIRRINKTNGVILGSITVNGLTSMVVNSAGDLFVADGNGISGFSSFVQSWNNPLIQNAIIGIDNQNIWASNSFYNGTNGRDSVFFWMGSLSTGAFSVTDTLVHIRQGFAGPYSILTFNNSAPLLLLGVVGSSYKAYTVPPFLNNATYSAECDLILAKYQKNTQPALGFGSSFWNVYDGDQHWLGGKKCPGGSSFDIDYKFYNTVLTPGNIVIAEMSDASGSFTNPYTLGALATTGNVGKITCTIPAAVPDGTGYQIRFRSTSPVLTSVQSSFPVGIKTPLSTISLTGSSTFCSKSKPIVCSYSGGNYVWQRNGIDLPNSNSSQFSPSLSGTYRCLVTETGYGVNSCSRLSSNTVTVTTLPLPSASLNPLSRTEVCNGDSVVLSLSAPGTNSFQWFKYSTPVNGATGYSYSAKATGSYKVIVTNGNGCTKTSSISKITVFKPVVKALGATAICTGGSVVLSVDTAQVSSIQWFKGTTPIAGQTGQYFIATQAAYYKAVCTYRNGCSATSNSIHVTITCRVGIPEEGSELLTLFPNPAREQLTIEADDLPFDDEAEISVMNSLGQQVFSTYSQVEYGSLHYELQLNNSWPRGIYLVRVNLSSQQLMSKVVVE